NHFGPLALVGVHEELHLLFQFIANAQAVVDDYVFQVINAAFHLVEPDGGAGKAVSSLRIVHQETVDVFDAGVGVDIGGEQVSMARLGTAVAANVQVPALLRGNDAEVFALSL